MMKRFYQLILLASQGFFIEGMVAAQPPLGGAVAPIQSEEQVTAALPAEPCALPNPECLGIGSNAYAFGSDATGTSAGMLLGNPHFPWFGTERFHTFQMTVPGEVNVYGMALYGVPLALIGFNEGVAWSHTVSTAYRFTPVELKLVPGDPTSYLIDGQSEAMTTREVEVCVATTDGECTDLRTHTFYYSRYGPIFLLAVSGAPVFGWDAVRAYSIRDANAVNRRSLDHFFDINRAQSTAAVKQVLESHVAIPWVNTIAADSTGHALYADISVVPNVPNSLATTCNTVPVGVAVFQLLGLPVLDGSRTSCEWVVDPNATQPGIFAPRRPAAARAERLHDELERQLLAVAPRTSAGGLRAHHRQRAHRAHPAPAAGLPAGDRPPLRLFSDAFQAPDGMPGSDVTLEKLQAMLYGNSTYPVLGNRNLTAELVRDDLVGLCRTPTPSGVASDDGATIDLTLACDVLEAWDLRHNLDSVGAHLFQEWWRLVAVETVWATPFDANDPVNTPRDLNGAIPGEAGARRRRRPALGAQPAARRTARQRAVRGPQRTADPDPRRARRHRRVQRDQQQPVGDARPRLRRAARLELHPDGHLGRERPEGGDHPHLLPVDRSGLTPLQGHDGALLAEGLGERALPRGRHPGRPEPHDAAPVARARRSAAVLGAVRCCSLAAVTRSRGGGRWGERPRGSGEVAVLQHPAARDPAQHRFAPEDRERLAERRTRRAPGDRDAQRLGDLPIPTPSCAASAPTAASIASGSKGSSLASAVSASRRRANPLGSPLRSHCSTAAGS